MTIYSTESMNLETVRMNYEKAVSDKKLCQKKNEALRTDIDCTVHELYFGSFQNL